MTVNYLTVEQILSLHEELITRFGGSLGVRDKGLLESAVHRCQQSFDGVDLYPSIVSKAASLFESLCKNHPFIDGNKRIAFLASTVFLELNGMETEFKPDEAESFILGIAAGKNDIDVIELFLRKAAVGVEWRD